MQWVPVGEKKPSYGQHVCIKDGRLVIATFSPYFYDVAMDTWSVEGITHYLEGIPPGPYSDGSGELPCCNHSWYRSQNR